MTNSLLAIVQINREKHMTQLKQNTSHAVMAQRYEPTDSLDNFPTPPWATRALCEQVLPKEELVLQSCLEPACGAGHMAKVLNEYFADVAAADIHAYGYGDVRDFSDTERDHGNFDWVITNPPFRLAEQFIETSLEIAQNGVAILARTAFLESVGRYNRLFSFRPPNVVAQFSERVPMVKGRLDAKASTATSYAWLIWNKSGSASTRFSWISPCRKTLERHGDYDEIHSSSIRPAIGSCP